jgi:hypothetical protein
MDIIYHHAFLTIVAAAGDNANYGLPGVGKRSRKISQGIMTFGNMQVAIDPRHPMEDIDYSTWACRAWTYQEAYYSRRLLIFTNEQVYFECGSGSRYEGSGMLQGLMSGVKLYESRATRSLINGPRLSFSTESQLVMEEFGERVRQYSLKSLTFGEDALNAFAGIMRRFEERPVGSWIPYVTVPWPLAERGHLGQSVKLSLITPLWQRVNSRPIERTEGDESAYFRTIWGLPFILSSKETTEEFDTMAIMALNWYQPDNKWSSAGYPDSQRRHQFPSWSWAGWSGGIAYHERNARERSKVFPLAKNFQFCDIATRSKLWHGRDKKNILSVYEGCNEGRLLRFDGVAVDPNHIAVSQLYGEVRCSVLGYRADIFLSQKPESPARFLQALRNKVYRAIWIYLDTAIPLTDFAIFILVIKLNKGVWQRLGMTQMVVTSSQDINDHALQSDYFMQLRNGEIETFEIRVAILK